MVRQRFVALRTPVVRYEQGACDIVADLATAAGLGLYRYGYFDPDIEIVKRLLRPGDTFVDGGANVGLFALAAASRVGPGGCVIALEPAPWARSALLRNIGLNRFRWVRVSASALGEGRRTAAFVAFPRAGSGLSSFAPGSTVGGELLTVAVVPLDETVPHTLWERLSIVKLDLEGAEQQALLGAQRILREAQPDLLLEVSDENLRRGGSSRVLLLRLLEAAGYTAFVPHAEPDGGLTLITSVEAATSRPSPNLFFTRNPGRALEAGVVIRSPGERQQR